MADLIDTSEFTGSERTAVPVEYNTRDLIIYALGIGSSDPRYIYEKDGNFAAFPTYPIVLIYKGQSFDVLPFPSPAMTAIPVPQLPGVQVFLDAEKLIEKVAELPKQGAKLHLIGGVVGVHNKGKGALIERLFELIDDTGKTYYKIVDGSFWVGATGFKDSGKSYSKTVRPSTGAPTYSVEVKTGDCIASLYRLSGDYNPLHVDLEAAKLAGFEQPILHGNCTLGHATRVLLDTVADGDQSRFRSVQLRYASPVVAGQTLIVEIWKESPMEFVFQVKVKETGKICVSNGLLKITTEAKL
eukprot:TRINITY_DN111418_c0_g1_i1.p1 TRINITY_DN111418_c0_g1~~TRINITY_DN111418_c0_g1_i1.p1  ORF type:complete len:307 (-),score=66.02 TRINITY_DN111418_c0_g1_i1:27-923(-)